MPPDHPTPPTNVSYSHLTPSNNHHDSDNNNQSATPQHPSSTDVLITMPPSDDHLTQRPIRNRRTATHTNNHNNMHPTQHGTPDIELTDHANQHDRTKLLSNGHTTAVDHSDDTHKPVTSGSVRAELPNILLLIFLYCLQGIPLGLSLGSIPFLLQSRLTYSELAVFSLCSWPYSLKLLWSPLVDIYYIPSIGQRKSWIVPMQVFIGCILILLSFKIDAYIESKAIYTITTWFVLLILFTATQDIAVDGWAVQLLEQSDLLSWCSTCQAIGQNTGFFISYSVFLALNEPSFGNYFRSVPNDTVGLVTLHGFMFYSGIVYLMCTVYLMMFKTEKQHVSSAPQESIIATYYKIYEIVQLPIMRTLIFVLLTSRVAFSAVDNLSVLKLVEYGLPKQTIALLAFLLFPFELIYPIVVSKYYQHTNNQNKLYLYQIGYPLRQFVALTSVFAVYYLSTHTWSTQLFILVFLLQIAYSFTSNLMFVNICSFFAQICDVSIGGTYMTLLNTLSNLGNAWPKPIVLYLTDVFTCNAKMGAGTWLCDKVLPAGTDGYYVLSALCTVFGAVWYFTVLKQRLLLLGHTDKSRFQVVSKS